MPHQINQNEQIEQKQLYQRAQMLLKAGDAQSADAICTDVLKRYPDDASFLCLSGHVFLHLKRYDDAKSRIDLLLTVYPEFDAGYDVRGDLFAAQEQLDDAIGSYKTALKLNAKRQQTRIKLGRILVFLGRLEEVQQLKQEFFDSSQEYKDFKIAAELEKEEKFEQAEKIYRDILIREPDNVTAMRLWAKLGTEQKFYGEAEKLLQRAVEKAPDFHLALIDLYEVQTKREKYKEAIDTAGKLIKLQPGGVQGQVMSATAYSGLGEHGQAIEIFNKALEIQPNHVGALCGKGNACRTYGDQDSAIAAFRKSIEVDPLHAEPYWSLGNLKTFRFEQSEVDSMLKLVGDERIKPEGQVQMNNALGHEFHNRKDYDRSFEFIDRGNKLRRLEEYYDPLEFQLRVDETIKVFTKEFLEEMAGNGCPESAPIFIVGLPRSGSTLIEQILSSHSQVEGTFELSDLDMTVRTIPSNPKLELEGSYPRTIINLSEEKFKSLGGEYIERTLRHRSDLPFFTDKNPNNFIHVGLLHLILPNAKIIDARRHPLDSCYGSYKQLFASGQSFSYDLTELGEYYLQYQRLMDHWDKVLPGKVLLVQYEKVVADTEVQIRRILEHCELDWEDNCLRFHETNRAVKTASSEQVRKPIYASSVNSWRRYETHLEELIEVLEPLLKKLPESDRPISLGA